LHLHPTPLEFRIPKIVHTRFAILESQPIWMGWRRIETLEAG
jgi:hypothetical protein